MLKGKRAYICSPLSAKTREERLYNMGLAKASLDTVREVFHCRTYASHAYLPLMLDDTIPEERKLALSIGKQLLDFCDVLIICGGRISSGMEGEIRYAHDTGKEVYWLEGGPVSYTHLECLGDQAAENWPKQLFSKNTGLCKTVR